MIEVVIRVDRSSDISSDRSNDISIDRRSGDRSNGNSNYRVIIKGDCS